nr:Xaa-Pro peptidase family protein [uncultured Clostridium sp.]
MKVQKIELLRTITSELEADGFFVYSPQWHKENYRFLTEQNFIGPFGIVLYLAKTDKTYVIYGSEWDQCKNEPLLKGLTVYSADPYGTVTQLLKEAGVKNLAISGKRYMPFNLAQAVGAAGVSCIPGEGKLETARMQKTEEEIGYLRQAVSLADQAWIVFMKGVADGLNEYQIVAEVEHYIKRHGAEDSFMLLATGGEDVYGMTPPMMRVAQPGQMVRTEITPQVNGWWAQICRTCVKGKANDNQKKAFDIFLEAEQAGFDMIRPGVNISDVAKAENDVFRKYGYGEYCTEKYTRVRGHGHGLDLDEMPLVLESTDLVLKENMVVVIHPNTFSPLCGYMVFGDPVLITKDGYELLSVTERKLFEV